MPSSFEAGSEYVGSATCAGCHPGISVTFMKSGHAWVLNPVVNGQPPNYPFSNLTDIPEGYTWGDISYVIGGYRWKAHYIDQEGYIITDRPGTVISDTTYLNQWNLANPIINKIAGWVSYHSGEAGLQYNCGECHTTGYSPAGSQAGTPGLVGNWAEPGVKCEACHGPGSQHASNPRSFSMQIDRDSESCSKCHLQNAGEAADATDGFILHHEQYGELTQGKHAAIDCVVCHDPHALVTQLHKAGERTTRMQCQDCHFKQAQYQKNETHAAMQIPCVECHMPRLVKSAWGDPEKFDGDLRTHRMAIDPNQIGQFSQDGKSALPQISLDFACRHCHIPGGGFPKTDAELTAAATGYHNPPVTP